MKRIGLLLATRLAQALFLALGISTLCFFLLRALPGDVAFRIAASRYGLDMVTTAAAEAVRAELNLDLPALRALGHWWVALLRFDLGVSAITGRAVWTELAQQLGHTVQLAVAAVALALAISAPLGVRAGLNPGGRLDTALLAGALLLRAIPPFLLGLLLIIAFALILPLAPAAGHLEQGTLFLPALTLALGLSAPLARIVRDAMAQVSSTPYYAFSRTKGLSEAATFWRHGLRNIAVPVLAYLATQLVFLIEGVVVIETLFAWPGIGHALIHALFGRDVPMIQGVVLVMSLGIVLFNALVDLVCLLLDPRERTV